MVNMNLNYLIVKMFIKLLHLLKKYWNSAVLNGIEKNIEKYWKSGLIENYWKNIENIDIDWTFNRKFFNY